MATATPDPAAAPGELESSEGKPFSTAYSYYVLGMLFLVYVFNFIDRQILAILLEPIKRDLQVSDTAMGFLSGFAFALFYTFGGLPIARWADHGSRRSIIALGLAIWSAMTAASGLARTFTHLALARIGVGIGEAAGSPPAHSLISDYFPPERRATALAIYSMGIYFGIMFGYLAGGYVEEWFGWRMAFFVVGIPGLALALLMQLTVREPKRGGSESVALDAAIPSISEVVRFLMARRSFVYLSLAAACQAFAGYGFASWVPTFLRRVHDMPVTEVAVWVGLITGFGGAIGSYVGGVISDRLAQRDVRWYMYIASIVAFAGTPFAAAFLLLADPTLALVLYIPSVVLGAMYLGPMFSMTQGLVKLRMRALASAVLLFIINIIGLGAGPQTVGIVNDLLDPVYGQEAIRYSLLLVALAGLLGGILFALASRSLREDLAARDA